MDEQDTHERYPERATIRDVARLADVSIGTASKALNGTGRLKQETRDKVVAAANELGFRPNSMAQSLHRAKSMTVGILSTDSFGRFTFPIVEALEERLAEHGIAIFMCNATDDPAREKQHLDQLLGKRIDGLLVTARRMDMRPAIAVPGKSMPVIYVFSQADDPDALCLIPDDYGGAVLGVQHLVDMGRRRIAHVTGPTRFEAVNLRQQGYADVLSKAGLPEIAGYGLNGQWSELWGREAVAALFDGKTETPDALFCGNDQIARGAVDGLRERGLDVPGDVAVVGFDNWDVMALAARPPLSSVDMNLRELGRVAGERLISMMAGERLRGVERLDCSLVVRQSSDPSKKKT
ncbi:MAG: LacI family DNA-binding transcriptional regulator [Candidatus Devosia phytovorans]|uniref:LacI family DNA-binding transcriptional regulator n=1 Tax=Candidatus Devosia phytovorans TaxID=3121372 RepID=A0AAJ5VTG4_9HYPH|nr:LacI family DNA-binding transcriptional regulator [Devosia sp.]WEK03302.1 MAG: LacI family DNA-binding transcriptional regulator [Devosia sp.]